MTQLSMSVQQTTEDVALMPAAETRWAALSALVYLDTREMALHALVNRLR